VAVVVGGEDDGASGAREGEPGAGRQPRVAPDALLLERGQLLRAPAVRRDAPQVELSGGVAREVDPAAVAPEADRGPQSPERIELLDHRLPAHSCHRGRSIGQTVSRGEALAKMERGRACTRWSSTG